MKDPYFEDIEAAFVSRRGKHLFLGPRDWTLVAEWKHKGIPLHIVIQAIDTVFKNHDGTRKINSISYCTQEVEARFQEWRDSQVGKNDSRATITTEKDYTNETLEKLRGVCNALGLILIAENMPERLTDAITEITPNLLSALAEFADNNDPQRLEEKLTAFEQQLNDALLESVPTTEGMRHLFEIESELSAYKSQLSKEEFANQINELFLKRLRERYDIPRLSLFYL